jgi:hypothetical protein
MIKKSTTVRMLIIMLQAVCLFLVFSSVSNATAGCNDPITKKQYTWLQCLSNNHDKGFCQTSCGLSPPRLNQKQAVTVVQYALIPIQFLITYVAYIMGFFFLSWGLYRLRHGHEGGGYNRQHSGAGTVLCFVAATMIFQYQWTTNMLGNSLLGPGGGDSQTGWDYGKSGSLPIDPENLFGYVQGATHDLRGSTVQQHTGSGILQSSQYTKFNVGGNDENAYMTLETLFAVLMVVGYISFLRGAMLLVKMGEGAGGGESSGTKAVVHIVAAGLLCNANHVTALIGNLSDQVNVSS